MPQMKQYSMLLNNKDGTFFGNFPRYTFPADGKVLGAYCKINNTVTTFQIVLTTVRGGISTRVIISDPAVGDLLFSMASPLTVLSGDVIQWAIIGTQAGLTYDAGIFFEHLDVGQGTVEGGGIL